MNGGLGFPVFGKFHAGASTCAKVLFGYKRKRPIGNGNDGEKQVEALQSLDAMPALEWTGTCWRMDRRIEGGDWEMKGERRQYEH
jgi:hypothetical protein